jgi:alpha-mannosidase
MLLLISGCFALLLSSSPNPAQTTPTSSGENRKGSAERGATLWVIPHTHWEGAVFKTREEYLEIGLPHILTALSLLRTHPEYRFVLDQVAYVKAFLERYPEQEAAFREFVSQGRLQIVGGNDVMLDVNIPSGESWVRQALYGKGYYREKLGVDVTAGWGLDTFGHHGQMPQLLKLAGYTSYWFQRGVHGTDVPSEFVWQGIDGTRIPAFWLPEGYGLFYPAPSNPLDFGRYARKVWNELGRFSRWPQRVALAGADVSEPEGSLPLMLQQFDRSGDAPFSLRFGVPSDFEAVVARRSDRPVVPGELNPVFQGVYSSRIELKQWMRDLERLLTTAEKLSALASCLGSPPETDGLTRAWEPVLFNQAHDLTSGTMVDKVYEDTLQGYQFSKRLTEEMIDNRLDVVASAIDTRGRRDGGIPVVVFNALGWPRSDLAEVDIGLAEPGYTRLELENPAGDAVPLQYVDAQQYGDGSLKQAKIAFIARDVPALGYSVYQVTPQRNGQSAAGMGGIPEGRTRSTASTMHEDFGSIENEHYQVTFDLWTGAITGLLLKADNWQALGRQPANVVAREQDGGDFWELYGTLNGGRLTAMNRQQGLPPPERSHFSNEYVGGSGQTLAGPVFSEFHIAHPFGDGSFATTVRLYPGIRRIDIRTELLNNDKFVRYRALFPSSIAHGQRFDEIPFGAIERPVAQEFPAQNWIDYSDGTHGLALLNHGLPGNNVAEGTLMLSLMRSARITAYPFFGGYEPGVSSDLGLELGKQLQFDYALVPHAADWREAGVYRAGLEFNSPLIVRKAAQRSGPLPKVWGLFEVSQPNVVTTALKPGRDGHLILRVYEASGKSTAVVKIRFRPNLLSAQESDLLENPQRSLDVQDNAFRFALRPYEIKTFSLKLSSVAGLKPSDGKR